ncbi:hypothetical protein A9Q94_12365 [Rhodobacterales bacterium 56_14_T64]|nr:hypothetical protein A9Q94_12365 [Rhodobacterales bacterium 56_14_T64]
MIIHRDLISALRTALEGRKVIAVTPGPALCTAFGIDAWPAATDPDILEWSTLVEAHAPLAERKMMRPLMRYTSGSTGLQKACGGAGPRKDFEDVFRVSDT